MLQITIDLSAIKQNYNIVKQQVGKDVHIGAVVKANAYGLGVKQVAPALHDIGCEKFFVAHLQEAIELRKILPKSCIAVFHGIENQKDLKIFDRYKLVPVLNTLEQCRWVEARDCILHIDTGMNRLGIDSDEVDDVPALPNLKYIMTHPACADDAKHKLNNKQLTGFIKAVEHVRKKQKKPIKASIANSPAIFLNPSFHMQAVRPGSCLYGINPTPSKPNPMQDVVTLTSSIIQIRHVNQKGTIGYSATTKAKKGQVLATVECGYADGYLRSASNKVWCMLHGQRVPVVGRISMDLIIVDITSISDRVTLGDRVTLMGDGITVDALAKCAGTIGYEVLTRLGSRAKRVYL